MRSIYSIFEGNGTSDDALWYRLGRHRYGFLNPQMRETADRNFKIKGPDDRANIIKWIRSVSYPFAPAKDEFIPRSQWDLDAIDKPSMEHVNHKHVVGLTKHILKTHKKKHDILVVMQCSNAKPYLDNNVFTSFYKRYKPVADFAWSCVSGIVPEDFTNLYPVRYAEWNHADEDEEMVDALNANKVDCILNFQKKYKYKKIIIHIPHPNSRKCYMGAYEENKGNCKDWMEFTINDGMIQRFADEKFDGHKGLGTSRVAISLPARKSLERAMMPVLDEEGKKTLKKISDEWKEAAKKRNKK